MQCFQECRLNIIDNFALKQIFYQTFMIEIKKFVFSAFGVNGFVLFDETGECILVDTACVSNEEKKQLETFIAEKHLTPAMLVNTHLHVDHVLGNNYLCGKYNIGFYAHKDGLPLLEMAPQYSAMFGFNIESVIGPTEFLEEGDVVKFGNSKLKVIYTPGHADGSICLISDANKFVITGDVLFANSIGRTDLPTGDFELLRNSIYQKLFTLPGEYQVLPGHGPETTIGHEKLNNPFL
jgi:glyoxylase-like metal-dependent hydrolase (beta-lactamase superfamily II)